MTIGVQIKTMFSPNLKVNKIFYKYLKNLDLPFAPFNKMEKIGKVCDFTLQIGKPQAIQSSAKGNYEEETEFILVEGKTGPKTKIGGYAKKRQIYKPTAKAEAAKKAAQQKQYAYNKTFLVKTKFKESTLIKSDWAFIHDVMKNSADKSIISSLPQTEVLVKTGTIYEYDNNYTKLSSKNEKNLIVKESNWHVSSSTSVDPIFLEIIEKEYENGNKNPVLFATDNIITSIMNLKHSNFPFELIVTKTENFLIMDKPEKSQQGFFDILTANENINANLPEEEKVLNFNNFICFKKQFNIFIFYLTIL